MVNEKLMIAAGLVNRIAAQIIEKVPEGYQITKSGGEFFPIQVFRKEGELIGAVRQCGEVKGVSANIADLSDKLGKIIEKALLDNGIPCEMRGKNTATFEKQNMY